MEELKQQKMVRTRKCKARKREQDPRQGRGPKAARTEPETGAGVRVPTRLVEEVSSGPRRLHSLRLGN